MNNSILVIHPYKYNGTWVFDDPATGLVKEPFVSGVPEIINWMTKDIPKAGKGFSLLFAATPFPGAIMFHKMSEEFSGTWYRMDTSIELMDGWLCPALFKYFPKAPDILYAKAEKMTK